MTVPRKTAEAISMWRAVVMGNREEGRAGKGAAQAINTRRVALVIRCIN
jgi:hypothetical protein